MYSVQASHSYISKGTARATICGAGSPHYSPVEAGYWAKARLEARPSRRGALQPAVFIVVAVVAAKFLGGG